jgi:hypothetical protein
MAGVSHNRYLSGPRPTPSFIIDVPQHECLDLIYFTKTVNYVTFNIWQHIIMHVLLGSSWNTWCHHRMKINHKSD